MTNEFGIYPENLEPELWWGAKALLPPLDNSNKGSIYILNDEQNFDKNAENSDAKEFLEWVNEDAISTIDKSIVEGVRNGSYDSEDGKFHCEWDDEEIGAYLHIGCWVV